MDNYINKYDGENKIYKALTLKKVELNMTFDKFSKKFFGYSYQTLNYKCVNGSFTLSDLKTIKELGIDLNCIKDVQIKENNFQYTTSELARIGKIYNIDLNKIIE